MDIGNVADFVFELGNLKRQRQSGFFLAGVKDPDTIAEHAMRAAQIGYILAVMENNPNPEKVATMVLIHDNGEARVGDQTKVAARYLSKKEPERHAFAEQAAGLGQTIEETWNAYYSEFENRDTPEGVIAKDADWLETAFSAKEHVEHGYLSAQNWIDNVEKALETGSAKSLLAAMKNGSSTDWWKDLKKMTHTKLSE